MSQINLFFFHGLPASGKDTQANLLLPVIPHSSVVSGVYRSALTQKGSFAKYHDQITPFIKPLGQGIDIPGKIVADVLADIIQEGKSAGITTFLVCGLLRTIDHKRALDKLMMENSELHAKHVYLNVSEQRALNQARVRQKNGASDGIVRVDDSNSYILARFARFKTKTLPMLKELKSKNELKIIDANRSIDKIYQETKSFLVPDSSILETKMSFSDYEKQK